MHLDVYMLKIRSYVNFPESLGSQEKLRIISFSKEIPDLRKSTSIWYCIISLIYFIHYIISYCPGKISHTSDVIIIQNNII